MSSGTDDTEGTDRTRFRDPVRSGRSRTDGPARTSFAETTTTPPATTTSTAEPAPEAAVDRDVDRDVDGDDDRDVATTGRRSQRVGAVTVLAVILAVVMLAAAAVFAVLYVRSRTNASTLAETRETVVSTASKLAVDFSSYDYRRLDAQFARVERQLTPAFRKSYNATADALKATLQQYRAVGTARVLDAGLTRLSRDTATVVLFLDQTVTRSTAQTPSVDRNRIRVRLERSGERWLVSALDVR